jgi:transposase-like protein
MLLNIIILSVLSVFVVILFIYFQNKKTVCPNCKSKSIIRTGNKKYKESPNLAWFGSPDSYYEVEYKCSKCGNTFWEKQKAVLFS